jgi:hypothetical protein
MDNIKMNLVEVGWAGVYWIALAQDRDKWRSLMNAVMKLRNNGVFWDATPFGSCKNRRFGGT